MRDDVDQDVAIIDDLKGVLEVVVSHGSVRAGEGAAGGLVLGVMGFDLRSASARTP